MGNKVQYVDISLQKTVYSNPDFYSEHSEDEIRNWMDNKVYSDFYDDLGEEVGWDLHCDEVEINDISISEQVLDSEPFCEYDDEIQEWIDGKPERERKQKVMSFLKSIREIHQRHTDNVDQIKEFIEDYQGREFLKDPSSFVKETGGLSDERKMEIRTIINMMRMIGLDFIELNKTEDQLTN